MPAIGKYDILVAIAARGIDVAEITHLINFDMPDIVDSYPHRIVRTGKAQNTGEAFTFASEVDASTVWQIEKILGARIERRCLAGFAPAERRTAVFPDLAVAHGRGRKFRLGSAGRKRRAR